MPMHKRKWLTDVYYIIMEKTRSIQSGERSKYKTDLCKNYANEGKKIYVWLKKKQV